jgi:hypothetical protein
LKGSTVMIGTLREVNSRERKIKNGERKNREGNRK